MSESAMERELREAIAEAPPSAASLARARALMPPPLARALQSMVLAARDRLADLRLDSRLTPALPGFRGPSGGFQMLYTAGGSDLFLRVLAPAEAGQFRVTGQLEAEEPESVPIVIVGTDASPLSRDLLTDADGVFETDLPTGRYDLVVGLDPPFLIPNLDLA